MSDNRHMLRIAVIGNEAETSPLIASAERLVGIECVCVSRDSASEGFDAVACCGSQEDGVQAICETFGAAIDSERVRPVD